MAIQFPVALDDLANVATGNTITPAHKNDLNDIVEALEAKVGIDSSAVATSHDYLLTHIPAQAQNLDIGAYELRAQTLESDVATGTAPLTIASTTVSTNLNADLLDGTHLAGLQTILTNSAGLAAALNDETGTGVAVFATTPTLVTPVLGVATATSINKVAITSPATSATLTIADGATLTVSASATISATPYTPSGTDVAIADGGTGASTAAAAITALLPAQTGNANKCLTTNATTASWQVLGTSGGGTGATAAANAASGVVVLNASSQLPAVSGALLTGISKANLGIDSGAYNHGTAGDTSGTITFNFTFTAAPVIVATPVDNTAGSITEIVIMTSSTTNCTYYASGTGGRATIINWIAVGTKA